MAFISKARILTYFRDRYKLKSSTNGWTLFECPYCEGQDLACFNLRAGWVKCFRACIDSSILQFVQDIEGLEENEARTMLEELEPSILDADLVDEINKTQSVARLIDVKITLPVGYNSIGSGEGSLAKKARNYLVKRGFDIDVLDSKGFGYCNEHSTDFLEDFYGYIIVPFKRNGQLVYYLGRNFVGDEKYRYKNPPKDFVGLGKSEVIYNEEALSLYKEVFILEGWSDAETIGKKATATLGWSMSPTQKAKYFNSQAKRLVFMPDAGSDDKGNSFYKKAAQLGLEFLDSGKSIYIVNPDQKMLTDRGKDANQIGREYMIEAYKNTKPLTWGSAMQILSS